MTISENIKQALEHIDEAKKKSANLVGYFAAWEELEKFGEIIDHQTLALEQLAQAIDALNSKVSQP